MQYLCPQHQQAIWLDPKLAMTIWNSAMENGIAAFRICDWETARRFLGTAYEVVLLYLRNVRHHRQGEFSVAHLVAAGRPLSKTLCGLRRFKEAEDCLLVLHKSLLQATAERITSLNRPCALDSIGRSVDALASALRLDEEVPLARTDTTSIFPGPGAPVH